MISDMAGGIGWEAGAERRTTSVGERAQHQPRHEPRAAHALAYLAGTITSRSFYVILQGILAYVRDTNRTCVLFEVEAAIDALAIFGEGKCFGWWRLVTFNINFNLIFK